MLILPMRYASISILVGASLLLLSPPAHSAEKKVTIVLGGNNCNWYLYDVKHALKKVPGVASVSFNNAQDKAIVTGDPQKMSPSQLVSSVDSLKGDGWSCNVTIAK